MTILNLQKKYYKKIDDLDLQLIISLVTKKSREFVLAHPEYEVSKEKKTKINRLIQKRINHMPLAYILGHKEFYGLNFKVNKHTLIPRPETELLVESVLKYINKLNNNYNKKQKFIYKHKETNSPKNQKTSLTSQTSILDIGTGSGNIIISLTHILKKQHPKKFKNIKFYTADISSNALSIAKQNAQKHKLEKKIKFYKSDLLKNKKLINELNNNLASQKTKHLIFVANLPYLSEKIYKATKPNVKNYEPKSALLSPKKGIAHYEKLFKQIKKLRLTNNLLLLPVHCSLFIEISPEQKNDLQKLIKKYFPQAKIKFKKDLTKKWRICTIAN